MEPNNQWFGSGLGQNGSTWNVGACGDCAVAGPRIAANATPIEKIRVRTIRAPPVPAETVGSIHCAA
jgi:hypothetical protein